MPSPRPESARSDRRVSIAKLLEHPLISTLVAALIVALVTTVMKSGGDEASATLAPVVTPAPDEKVTTPGDDGVRNLTSVPRKPDPKKPKPKPDAEHLETASIIKGLVLRFAQPVALHDTSMKAMAKDAVRSKRLPSRMDRYHDNELAHQFANQVNQDISAWKGRGLVIIGRLSNLKAVSTAKGKRFVFRLHSPRNEGAFCFASIPAPKVDRSRFQDGALVGVRGFVTATLESPSDGETRALMQGTRLYFRHQSPPSIQRGFDQFDENAA